MFVIRRQCRTLARDAEEDIKSFVFLSASGGVFTVWKIMMKLLHVGAIKHLFLCVTKFWISYKKPHHCQRNKKKFWPITKTIWPPCSVMTMSNYLLQGLKKSCNYESSYNRESSSNEDTIEQQQKFPFFLVVNCFLFQMIYHSLLYSVVCTKLLVCDGGDVGVCTKLALKTFTIASQLFV